MRIYNTLTRKKEEFTPIEENHPRIYACGPTVYNYIHIGNARPICVFDVLRRYMEYRGMQVDFVQNFTDIDDKLIKKANEEGVTVAQVAQRYMEEYFVDAQGLNIREATVHPKATENIGEIQAIVSSLIEQGYAYEAKGDVYFRTRKFKEYGKLSHMPLEELSAGASERVDLTDIKEDSMDFCLWKSAKEGEPYWESPWGKGRPGWHIECSAMARRYLGETIDIHCGGQDLIFPHHENEIAQSECCNHKPFARYWMHNGYINVDNRKMSKSLGNFFTVRDVAKEFGYEPIRYLMVASHYRSPINYSFEVMEQCKAGLERLYNCLDNLKFTLKNAPEGEIAAEYQEKLDAFRQRFIQVMDDDLNTADGLSVLFDLAKEINTSLSSAKSPNRGTCQYALDLYRELAGVLGLLYRREEEDIDGEIEALIAQRTQARKDKNFALADQIRDELKARNIILEDTPQGVKWSRG